MGIPTKNGRERNRHKPQSQMCSTTFKLGHSKKIFLVQMLPY